MEEGRINGLDGLRGLASLIVMVHHVLLAGSVTMCAAFIGQGPGGVSELLATSPLRLVWAGHEAVRVFFVLSGFVLVLPYAQGKRFMPASYYPSRLLRLYLPAVAAVVLATVLHSAIGWEITGTWWLQLHGYGLSTRGFLNEASLLAHQPVTAFPLITAIWTLKWEVLFSLVLPVAVLLVSRGRLLRLAIVVGCLALIGYGGPRDFPSYVPLFPIGAAAAYELPAIGAFATRIGAWWTVVMIGFAMLVTVPAWWTAHVHLPLILQAVAAAGLVVTAATGAAGRLLTSTPLRWLGKRSFSLYLVHEPLIVSTAFVIGATGPLATYMVVAIPVALIGAELFYRLVEHPAHRFARRIAKRGVGRTREAPVAA